ncbi:MAG: hypothetical protein LH614_21405 [Pyrinomonadaceae bacterium]|nr:hypothetical protein [Pyrinomonadaceae bacterium]
MKSEMFVLLNWRALRSFSFLTVLSALIFFQTAVGQTPSPSPLATPAESSKSVQTGKPPVIIIPGLIGSELINKTTDETVWFNIQRSKTDDLRLPISTNLKANTDNLVAGDIIRNIKYLKFLPETEIYQSIASSLILPGYYKEGSWETPDAGDFQDTYYVFPYDWRRDNVESARLLMQKINALKLKLKRPDLKFNIVAHSMGGLVARYAAMYGDADLPSGTRRIVPTWAGAKSINKIFLVGTPNEGSAPSLSGLLNGYSITRINLPFVQSISKFDMFTIPSVYQLLPHGGTLRAFDENLKPLRIDIFNPATWEKYGWAAYTDPKFVKEFTIQEQAQAKSFFRVVLNRAKHFQEALDANITAKSGVPMYLLGSDCKPTIDGVIILRDGKKNRWRTIFDAKDFKRSDGTKVSGKELEDVLYAMGDGVVTQRSLLTSSLGGAKMQGKYKAALPVREASFVCATHNLLLSNAEVQNKLFADLISKSE